MNFISPVGCYISDKDTGIKQAEVLLDSAYSFVIVNCSDLGATVATLRKLPREYNIIAHLDVKQTYIYGGSQKTMEAAFGILYDFVDAFLISSIDSLSDDVDSLLNLRMYNDEYRPIILQIPSDILRADLDEIIDYSLLSNIDGCLISDLRLLKHASSRCKGYMTIMAGNVNSAERMMEVKNNGAELFCTDTNSRHIGIIQLGRHLLRTLHKLA